MFPSLSYSANLYSPTKGLLRKMDVHWQQVQGRITNCLRSTPIPILAPESCVLPLSILLEDKRWMAVLGLVLSPPTFTPTLAPLFKTSSSPLEASGHDSHRALCTHLAPNCLPLNLKPPLPSPPVRTHLPVEALAHLTLSPLDGH